MSNLANEIQHLLGEYNLTGAQLAHVTGLNPAQISRWKNGEQVSIKKNCLKQLAEGFSVLPKIHARLLLATINDFHTGPGAQYISI